MLAVLIPLYILVTLGIGFWASTKVKSTEDFTLAGKSLSTSFVGVTLFATWFGSGQIMGNPGYFVEEGMASFITLTFSGTVCLLIVGYFYAKKLYAMNIVTVGDFFRVRFNKSLELAVSLITIFSYPHWIAAQFIALAYLFEIVFGIPVTYGVLISASIVVLYTYIGGMWAVSYTDMLQSILIIVGLVILLWNVLSQTGGIVTIFEDKSESFFSLFPPPGLENWSVYIATFMAFSIGAIPVQEIYQRVFSAKSEKAAVNGLYLSAALLLLIPSIPLVIALGSVYLHPELIGDDHGQSIILLAVAKFASLPVQVLFYGAMISAIMSTSSGAMLAPATVIGENLLKPNFKSLTDKHILLFTRLSVVLMAAIACYFALGDLNIVSLVVASLSLIMVCILAPFTLGLFWKKSSIVGAWCGVIVGGSVWFVCYLMETLLDPTIIATPMSFIAMFVGSLIVPDKENAH